MKGFVLELQLPMVAVSAFELDATKDGLRVMTLWPQESTSNPMVTNNPNGWITIPCHNLPLLSNGVMEEMIESVRNSSVY